MAYSNTDKIINGLVLRIHLNKEVKDPNKMAHIIYFVIKQNPMVISKRSDYTLLLKTTKTVLLNNYGWTTSKINKCFCILYSLLKYIKKST